MFVKTRQFQIVKVRCLYRCLVQFCTCRSKQFEENCLFCTDQSIRVLVWSIFNKTDISWQVVYYCQLLFDLLQTTFYPILSPCHLMPCHVMSCHPITSLPFPCHAMPCHSMPSDPTPSFEFFLYSSVSTL